MAGRHPLPVTPDTPKSVDAVREKLGGRGTSLPGAGALVALRNTNTVPEAGVVLFVSEGRFDVWFGGGIVRRLPRDQFEPFEGAVRSDFMVVSSDVRVFSDLQEGQTVRFSSGDDHHDQGTLVEKCRYGGLVRREDGVLVGVGFQRLWPATETLPH